MSTKFSTCATGESATMRSWRSMCGIPHLTITASPKTSKRKIAETWWAEGFRFMQPGGMVLNRAVDYCIRHALDVKNEQHAKDLRPMVTKAVLQSVKDRWKNVRSAHRTAMKKKGER